MTYAFTHMGNFSLLLLLRIPPPPVSRPISQPRGWDMGLEADIWAWRLGGGGNEKGKNSPYV